MFGERLKELRGDKTQDYIAYHICEIIKIKINKV